MKTRLFSDDDHVDLLYLPPDLWQKRVPSAFRDRAPRVENTPEGKRWMVGKEPLAGVVGFLPKADNPFLAFGKSAVVVDQGEGRWRATTPALRLADMDRDGVQGHVLYGPVSALSIKDPELGAVYMHAYNEWIAEFSKANTKRLIGLGFLPVTDAAAAVRELAHCAKLGLKGVQFNPFAAYKFVWDEAWEPLWAKADETGMPISFHVGGGVWSCGRDVRGGNTFGPPGRGVYDTYGATMPNQLDEVLCSVVMSGILKRYPSMRAVLAEGGIGWIPYILERMDRKYEEHHVGSKRSDGADLDFAPSKYYQRQIYATFQEDPIGVKFLDLIGPQTVMWASDYPHHNSVWPQSRETIAEMFQGVDEKVTQMVVCDNAEKLYT